MYTNTDVLHNKLDELESIALKEKVDIIGITETLLKNMPADTKPEDFVFKIRGYNSIINYNGRGLCFFIKENIEFIHILDYESYFKTSIFLQIKNLDCILTMGLIYRSPSSTQLENDKLIDMIDTVANKHKSLNNKLLLLGDFNFPGIDWELESTKHVDEAHIENKFLSCLHSNFLYQIVEQPTHTRCDQTPTLIDLIITKDVIK